MRPGLDLRAEIDTVVGYNDSALRNVKVWLQKRNNKLTALDARGVLEGNKAFAAVVRPEPGQAAAAAGRGQRCRAAIQARRLLSQRGRRRHESRGQPRRLGRGRSAPARYGPRISSLLGDAIGGDLLVQRPTAPCGRSGRPTSAASCASSSQFETLRVPFSVGHGQFLLNEARLDGPVLSANMRGKIDFRSHILNVGGTFTPLAGLNTMFRGPAPVRPTADGAARRRRVCDDVRHSRLDERSRRSSSIRFSRDHARHDARDHADGAGNAAHRAARPAARSQRSGPRASSAPAAATSSNGFEAGCSPRSAAVGRPRASRPRRPRSASSASDRAGPEADFCVRAADVP